jgi:hypothetical protein
MWLKKSGWGPELRPDRLGLVVDENLDLIIIDSVEFPAAQIWVAAGHDDDWAKAEAQAVISTLLDGGVAVLWRLSPGDRARTFRADGRDRMVMSQIVPTPRDSVRALPPTDTMRMLRAEQLLTTQRQKARR